MDLPRGGLARVLDGYSNDVTKKVIAVVVLLLGAIAVGGYLAVPSGYADYQQAALHACEQAMASARTAELVGRADLQGKTLPGYSSRALTDGLANASSALASVTERPVPDAQSQLFRDQVVVLLVEAVRRVADVQSALPGPRTALAKEIAAVAAVAGRLNDLIRRSQ